MRNARPLKLSTNLIYLKCKLVSRHFLLRQKVLRPWFLVKVIKFDFIIRKKLPIITKPHHKREMGLKNVAKYEPSWYFSIYLNFCLYSYGWMSSHAFRKFWIHKLILTSHFFFQNEGWGKSSKTFKIHVFKTVRSRKLTIPGSSYFNCCKLYKNLKWPLQVASLHLACSDSMEWP